MWVIGIDPGYVRTGVVIKSPAGYLQWATFDCREGATVNRAWDLAEDIMRFAKQTVTPGEPVLLAIELPVWTHNPSTFVKQCRLIQQIEADFIREIGQFAGARAAIAEIIPSQSKLALAGKGDANKAEMIAASPFADMDMPLIDKEALADAYGHMLAGQLSAITKISVIENIEVGIYVTGSASPENLRSYTSRRSAARKRVSAARKDCSARKAARRGKD